MTTRVGRGLTPIRALSALSAVLLLFWTFRAVDFARVTRAMVGVGFARFAIVLLPALLALSLECVGWSEVFRGLGQRVSVRPLLRVRLMTEAVAQTLPMGVLWAESMKPVLLGRHAAMPVSRAVAGILVRKYLLIASQAVSVGLLSSCGFATLRDLSQTFTGRPDWAWFAFGVSATLALLALLLRGAVARGKIADRLLAWLRRIPNARLQQRLIHKQQSFVRTDALTERYFSISFMRSSLAPGVFFLGGWLCEALESYLILKLLGVELGFFAIASVEVMLSFAKNVLFVLPSGIGVQDIGYVSCLSALGIPDALTIGAAFCSLKRGKELFWAAIGYSLLLADKRPELALSAQLNADVA